MVVTQKYLLIIFLHVFTKQTLDTAIEKFYFDSCGGKEIEAYKKKKKTCFSFILHEVFRQTFYQFQAMICLKFLFFGEKCLINTILYFYFLQWIFYPLIFPYLLLIGFEILLLYKINIFGLPPAYFHCISYKVSNWNCRPFTTWIIIRYFPNDTI